MRPEQDDEIYKELLSLTTEQRKAQEEREFFSEKAASEPLPGLRRFYETRMAELAEGGLGKIAIGPVQREWVELYADEETVSTSVSFLRTLVTKPGEDDDADVESLIALTLKKAELAASLLGRIVLDDSYEDEQDEDEPTPDTIGEDIESKDEKNTQPSNAESENSSTKLTVSVYGTDAINIGARQYTNVFLLKKYASRSEIDVDELAIRKLEVLKLIGAAGDEGVTPSEIYELLVGELTDSQLASKHFNPVREFLRELTWRGRVIEKDGFKYKVRKGIELDFVAVDSKYGFDDLKKGAKNRVTRNTDRGDDKPQKDSKGDVAPQTPIVQELPSKEATEKAGEVKLDVDEIFSTEDLLVTIKNLSSVRFVNLQRTSPLYSAVKLFGSRKFQKILKKHQQTLQDIAMTEVMVANVADRFNELFNSDRKIEAFKSLPKDDARRMFVESISERDFTVNSLVSSIFKFRGRR